MSELTSLQEALADEIHKESHRLTVEDKTAIIVFFLHHDDLGQPLLYWLREHEDADMETIMAFICDFLGFADADEEDENPD